MMWHSVADVAMVMGPPLLSSYHSAAAVHSSSALNWIVDPDSSPIVMYLLDGSSAVILHAS